MIEIRLDELLGKRGRTFYWLAKETGISHTTLWRPKKGRALGCQPGDVLRLADEERAGINRATPP